jgi:uncharacterized membrane protein (UPF0127 family)
MIINITKNKIIAQKSRIARNTFTRFIGLMGRKSLVTGEALVLYPCSGIHTYFMRFSIDCIFLDQNNCVIHIIRNLKPWKITPIIHNSRTVIELPGNSLSELDAELGDKIYKFKAR